MAGFMSQEAMFKDIQYLWLEQRGLPPIKASLLTIWRECYVQSASPHSIPQEEVRSSRPHTHVVMDYLALPHI